MDIRASAGQDGEAPGPALLIPGPRSLRTKTSAGPLTRPGAPQYRLYLSYLLYLSYPSDQKPGWKLNCQCQFVGRSKAFT